MAINGCLLDFCLNGSKVPTTVRPAHYAKTCCNLRTLATRGIELKQFSASHVAPVWPLRTTTKVAVPLLATHPVHAWSTGCSADIIKHIDYAHSKDADSEVDPSHSSAHDQTSWEDCEEHKCNNTNAVDGDVTLNSDSGLDITNAEDTMKLQNMKKIRRNKVKVSERVRSKSHKKRSGRTCPQPDVVQDQAVVHPAALTTVDAAWDNVQLPVITPLSEDSLKPTASWVQNKSVVRLRDPATCGTDQSTSVSSPVLHAKLCQTPVTTLGPGICALTSVSVLTTKNRYDGTSPLRKSTTRQCGESKPKVTKVFWSEAQTLNQNQLGMSFPGAPPCTPTPELAQHYEYVASMTDIRAQRALRAHLDAIDQIQKRKAGRDREMQRKREKIYQKTQQIEAKKKQRSQIYALNKIMTEMEHKLFTEFCKQNIDTA